MREYLDVKRKRILLENGKSLVTPERFAEQMLRGNDTSAFCVEDEYEIETVKTLLRLDISPDGDPEYEDISLCDDQAWDLLMERIIQSDRFQKVISDPYIDRVEREMEFFRKSRNLQFLLRTSDLIERFKQEGVVWGVGRGSSCASLVCYLLEINDIDPIRFKIPFSELSKEQEGY